MLRRVLWKRLEPLGFVNIPGGPLADRLAGRDPEAIIAIACRTVAGALGLRRTDLAAELA